MYRGAREVWRGWRKNTSVGLAEGSPLLAGVAALGGIVVSLWPYLAVARESRALSGGTIALQIVARWEVEGVAPTPPLYRLTLPLGSCFLSVTSLVSTLDRVRGRVSWRGRSYVTDPRGLRRRPRRG
jgi:hypothetical protein